MKNNINLNITNQLSLKKRAILWIVAMCIFMIFSYVLTPDDPMWAEYSKNPFMVVLKDLLLTFVLCIMLAEISLLINRILDKRLTWTHKPRIRLAIQTALNIVSSLLFLTFVCFLTFKIYGEKYSVSTKKEIIQYLQWVMTTTIVSLAISGINTLNYLLSNWKNALLETAELKLTSAKLKEAAMEAELRSLKLQIDPHFIFNNLSVLSELILEDQQMGHEYAEHFAKVYRYLLLNSQKNLISIGEEIIFLKSYIFLLQKRFGNGVDFNIHITENIYQKNIPPFTLQMLVENAIKHNQTSKTKPLHIQIFNESDQFIIVKNTLNPLLTKVVSTGFGLKNIASRYSYLIKELPETIKTDEWYIVKIPINI